MLAYANELLEDEKAMLEMMIEDHRESWQAQPKHRTW